MKNDQFHIPFIKNLALIVFLTLVSMGTAHILIQKFLSNPQKTSIFTSQQSQQPTE